MFSFVKRAAQKQLSFEDIQILQFVAQQVVLSIEGSVRLKGSEKKALALQLMSQILRELKMVAPDVLLDAMVESSVSILKTMNKALEKEKKPRFSFDISGRPGTGN